MFRSGSGDNYPALETFEDAKRYLEKTKPMQSRRNKGTIPLKTNRQDSDKFYIFEREGRHPFSDKVQTEIVCHMHHTEIYRLFEDGTTYIDDYDSVTTHAVLGRLTRRGVGSNYVAFSSDELLFPEYMSMFLPVGYNNGPLLVPFDDGLWFQRINDKIHLLRHGYAFGPGRKNVVPKAESMIRAIHATCRAAADFAGVDRDKFVLGVTPKKPRVFAIEADIAHTKRVIDSFDWQPGDGVTASLMSHMFEQMPSGVECFYKEHLAWTSSLRTELKTVHDSKYNFLSAKGGEELYDYLERVALGID